MPGPRKYEGILREKVVKHDFRGAKTLFSNSGPCFVDSITSLRNRAGIPNIPQMFGCQQLSTGRTDARPTKRRFGASRPVGAPNSPFSPVDRSRLLTAPSDAGSQENIQTAPRAITNYPPSPTGATSLNTTIATAIADRLPLPGDSGLLFQFALIGRRCVVGTIGKRQD